VLGSRTSAGGLKEGVMNYQTAMNYLTDQFLAGLDAPVPLAVVFVLAALLGAGLTRLYYAVLVARLRKSVERKESMILALRGVAPLATAARAQAQPRAAEAAADLHDPRVRQRALLKITKAIDAAAIARRSIDPGERAVAVDAMTVALLAARTGFGLPIPEPGTPGALDLEAGARLLELIRPALFLAQDEEARRSTEMFLRHMAAPKAPPRKRAASA
jgi:hypothetical protein